MRTLSTPTINLLNSGRVGLAQLVRMDLTQTLRMNTSSWNLEWDGFEWMGVGNLGRVEEVETAPGEIKGLRLTLSGVLPETLSLALAEPIQGRPCELLTAIFDTESFQVVDVQTEWAGLLDTMPIREAGSTAEVAVTAEHIGVELLRPRVVLYSDQEQQRLYPGDRGLEYVIDQADKSIVWPAASFFRR